LSEEALQPKLMLGGFYSLNMKAHENFINVMNVSGYPEQKSEGGADLSSLFRKNQFGIIGAVAAEVKILTYPVSFEFRYQYNLNPISKAANRYHYALAKTHDRWGNDLYLSTLSFNVAVRLLYL
jgi:hypothetical protein